jgi:hypothetical protein
MLQKKLATGVALLCTLLANAQIAAVQNLPQSLPSTPAAEHTDPTPPKTPFLNFSGSADLYYRYDFDRKPGNNKTSFTNSHNSFALGMASLKVEHTGDKVNMVADLGFGKRAEEFSYNEEGLAQAVKQLYISYTPAAWVKFTAGTWATHVGYELLDPQLNRNYSMSYMFTNGPFSHTGVKAELSRGKHHFMIGVSNATDYRIPKTGQINRKFILAQYNVAPSENTNLYLNYVGGKGPDTAIVNQFDIVATAKLSSMFNIGINGTLNETQNWSGVKNETAKAWWGAALYVNADFKSNIGLTLRSEWFDDSKGMKGIGTSIWANTLSASFKAGGFIFIPEIRFESAKEAIYSSSNDIGKKNSASLLFATIYTF